MCTFVSLCESYTSVHGYPMEGCPHFWGIGSACKEPWGGGGGGGVPAERVYESQPYICKEVI